MGRKTREGLKIVNDKSIDKKADKRQEELEKRKAELLKDRSKFFDDIVPQLPLIKTRGVESPVADYRKYVDIAWYNFSKKEWEGNFNIEEFPSDEIVRLGILYKNPRIVYFIDRADIKKFQTAIAKGKKEAKNNLDKLKQL